MLASGLWSKRDNSCSTRSAISSCSTSRRSRWTSRASGRRRSIRAAPVPLWRGEVYRHDKIRVAYLSADFRTHATALLMAGRVRSPRPLALRDHRDLLRRRRQEPDARASRSGLRPLHRCAQRRAMPRSPQLLRDARDRHRRRSEGLHAGGAGREFSRIARRRSRRSYLGYPGTMGAAYIDYVIADRIVIPEEHRPFFTRAGRLSARHAISATTPSARSRRARRARRGRACPRTVSCSAASTTTTRSRPRCSTSGCGCCARSTAACCGCLQDNRARGAQPARAKRSARGVAPERLVFARALHAAPTISRGSAWPICSSIRCPTTRTRRQRCAVGGAAGAHRAGRTFRRPRRGEPALGASALPELITHSLDDYEALALKLARDPRRAHGDQGEARAPPRHARAVRHGPLHRATSKPPT